MAADNAASGEDDRILGIGNHGCSGFNLRFQGRFRLDGLALQWPFVVTDGHFTDIDRQVDEGSTWFFPFGIFKGEPCDFCHRIRPDDRIGAAGNRFKHRAQVQILMGRNVHLVCAYLTGNSN